MQHYGGKCVVISTLVVALGASSVVGDSCSAELADKDLVLVQRHASQLKGDASNGIDEITEELGTPAPASCTTRASCYNLKQLPASCDSSVFPAGASLCLNGQTLEVESSFDSVGGATVNLVSPADAKCNSGDAITIGACQRQELSCTPENKAGTKRSLGKYTGNYEVFEEVGGEYVITDSQSHKQVTEVSGRAYLCSAYAYGGWGVYRASCCKCKAEDPLSATRENMFTNSKGQYKCYYDCVLWTCPTAAADAEPSAEEAETSLPAPTESPTLPPPTRAPSVAHDCESFCETRPLHWDEKCVMKKCRSCSQCQATGPCEEWCWYDTRPWKGEEKAKCTFSLKCGGCSPCRPEQTPEETTPAPEQTTPACPAISQTDGKCGPDYGRCNYIKSSFCMGGECKKSKCDSSQYSYNSGACITPGTYPPGRSSIYDLIPLSSECTRQSE